MKDKLLLIIGLILTLFGIWASNQSFPTLEGWFETLGENDGAMIIIPTESTPANDALLDAYLTWKAEVD